VRVRDRLGIGARSQRRLSRAMQILLVVVVAVGLYGGDAGVVANGAASLAITFLPAALERDAGIPMDSGVTLWITTAVFLHALGTLALPGAELSIYRSVGWWNHLTHALSSSVVAAGGYATIRAIDVHVEGVSVPHRVMFVFILLFVLAFGVLWEVFEFALGELAAATGTRTVLTQYGLADTMLDLVFDALGGLAVAAGGHVYLSDVVDGLVDRLAGR